MQSKLCRKKTVAKSMMDNEPDIEWLSEGQGPSKLRLIAHVSSMKRVVSIDALGLVSNR